VVVGELFAIIVSCGLDHALTVLKQPINGGPHVIDLIARGEHHRTRHQLPFLTEQIPRTHESLHACHFDRWVNPHPPENTPVVMTELHIRRRIRARTSTHRVRAVISQSEVLKPAHLESLHVGIDGAVSNSFQGP
jgi:hypothetical protein